MDSYYLFCCLFDQIEKVVNNLVLGEVFAAFPAFQLLADLNTHRNKWANKLPNTRTKAKRSFNDILWDTFSNKSNDLDNYKNIVINNDVITYPPCEYKIKVILAIQALSDSISANGYLKKLIKNATEATF